MQNLNRDDRREMRRQMVNSLVLLLVVLGCVPWHIFTLGEDF
jgi:hypothetical protein